ncbi:MFS transporter [Draconibacterium halophilum]|uniref:MFS transporter n=1 Tax=Draconibacterium halophilum TaxID=2706887 RepID=A0A6C0R8Q4_9BACT|nr:MFS transporter [Draconibacterium halophilum]QIA06457.1 MFS transporter [Draconibacterium halophilum]
MRIFKDLNPQESLTLKLHLFYSGIEGIAAGALLLTEFIFIKSLKGSNVQLAFLFQFNMVVFLFAMVANEILRRYTNRKVLLRTIAIVSKLPLVGLAFFPDVSQQKGLPPLYHTIFLAIFLLYFMSRIVAIPSVNQYLKGNYRHENFGRLFGYSVTVQKVAMLASTFTAGLLLDWNPNSYKVFYPIVGILAIVSIFQLTKIKFVQKKEIIDTPLWKALQQSFHRIFQILKHNKAFRHLEMGFMLYGFAWMSTHAVITIFYERALHLNYSSVAFYKNAFNLVAIAFLPFFGKFIGKRDPRRFAIITFGSLMLFILFTALTEYYNGYTEVYGIKIYYMLMIAVFFNGLFMGSMPILWGIGSSYFCQPDEAADYQSVHLFLTGLRALLAPIIGIKLYEWAGYSYTYATGVVLLFFAILLMIWSEKRVPKTG